MTKVVVFTLLSTAISKSICRDISLIKYLTVYGSIYLSLYAAITNIDLKNIRNRGSITDQIFIDDDTSDDTSNYTSNDRKLLF